jgi:hypothetical protein
MPTPNWIGKEVVINHHNGVPYRLLRCDGELSAGDPGSGNVLIEADNLEALKALLPYYAGRVKCIYINHASLKPTTHEVGRSLRWEQHTNDNVAPAMPPAGRCDHRLVRRPSRLVQHSHPPG